MGEITQRARDSNIQPYIVSKKKAVAEIIRKASGDPGGQAPSMSKAAELRVGQYMKLATLLAVPGIVNLVRSGNVLGRPGTPVGNFDSMTNDEKGRPQSTSWFGDMTELHEFLRGTGAAGYVSAKREGLTEAQSVSDAVRGVRNTFLLRWLSSPTLDLGSRLAIGKTIPQAFGAGGPQAEPDLPSDSFSQRVTRTGVFAARHAGQLIPFATKAADQAFGTETTPTEAPDAVDEATALLHMFGTKHGMKESTVEKMPDWRNRDEVDAWSKYAKMQKSNLSDDDWKAWVLKRTEDLEPKDRAQARAALLGGGRRVQTHRR